MCRSWVSVLMLAISGVCLTAEPALAQPRLAAPEPTDLIIWGVAVVGLIIGHQASRKKPRD